jgi:hypothetical protein
MNARCFRALIFTVLWTVHLLGGLMPGMVSAQAVKLPACRMACCVKDVCECQPVLSDAPTQPAPVAPVAPKLETKFVPTLLALLAVPVAGNMPNRTLLPTESLRAWNAQATPIFRLHCALLM